MKDGPVRRTNHEERRTRPALAALVSAPALLALACPPAPTPPPPPPPLAPAEVADLTREVLEQVSALRGLPIGEPPEIRVLPPAAFAIERDSMTGAAAGGAWGDDLLVGLRVLAGLGLATPDQLTTRGTTGSEIGSYDCEEDVIRVADLSYLPPPPELLDTAGEAPPGWRELSVSLHGLLAHESVHALLRRAFPLSCPALRMWPDRDGELAVRALEEGDADEVLAAVVSSRATPDALDLDLWIAPLDDPATAEPPVGFDYLMRFPYDAGARFARALDRSGGNAARDAAFRRAPESTEQILHPERYFAGDAPARVTLPDFPVLRDQGYLPAETGTLGEAGIVAFVSEPSPGWQVLLSDVVPLPPGLCNPPPEDCSGLTELPGVSALPPGVNVGLELVAPEFVLLSDDEAPTGVLALPPSPPAGPSENWALRDEQGRMRPAAWSRILAAADGWHGDAAAFWLRADQDVPSVIWTTVWDDACDAEQFRREVNVARPAWGACRRGNVVHVVGGLPRDTGADVLSRLARETVVEETAGAPFAFAYAPPPGRLEERAVAELGTAVEDGWPARAEVPYSPGGPTVLRRWVDEEAKLVVPLPAGPYWALAPALLQSPLARGIALERVGGGLLVVASIIPAADAAIARRLAAIYGEFSVLECPRGPARGIERSASSDDGSPVTERAMLVDAGDRIVVVAGRLPAGTAEQSREEFAAAFLAACDPAP
ncbi:MAG: hypothetical protein HY905_16085 [Deltaproteobacteria bacterium]|nr:hypothetical protein [Deltaproteobacteria bacterium]